MTEPRLPDGFAVQIDRRVQTLGPGTTLLGGSPRRLLRLSPTARRLLSDTGRLEVRDALSAQLARTLLDATVAHPRPAGGPSHRDVTVVIPVRDNHSGLRRLLGALRGMRVIVVDDGSAVPVEGGGLPVTVVRHAVSKGPAAARNTGIAHCDTDFVAFLDSDVVPAPGWLEILLGHFCDPAVALAAPRIVALGDGDSLLSRYETTRSALDMGPRESPVLPYSPVSYVPSAAMICRRSAIAAVQGFDESMAAGEDVDLCWRLVGAGFRLRYEPVARVGHDHRTRVPDWLSRRAFYGTSAAPLAVRHPDKTAALVLPMWSLLAWLLLTLGSWTGVLGALACAGMYTRRVARSVRSGGDDATVGDVARLALGGLGSGAVQLASATCRSYWPASVAVAALWPRFRRVILAAALVDGFHAWAVSRRDADRLGPLGYLAVKRLDDLAYGAGLWTGMIQERTLRPLKADIRP